MNTFLKFRLKSSRQIAFTAALTLFVGMSSIAYALPLSGTGFAGFTAGSVNGQGGWSSTGPWDQAVVTLLDGTGHGNVWRVSNAIISGSFGDMPFAPRPGGIPTDTVNNPVNSDPLFFAGESSTGATFKRFFGEFSFRSATGAAQPGLRITVSIDNGQGARQSFVALRDTGSGITIETTDVKNNGEFPTVNNDNIHIVYLTIAHLDYTHWHTIRMEAHFVNGPKNDKVKYFVDGKLVHVGPSWEQFYRHSQSDIHPKGVPVQTLLFRFPPFPDPSSPAPTDVSGHGYYIDNVFTSNSKTAGHDDGKAEDHHDGKDHDDDDDD
jgi:hypothetical protein